MNASPPSTSSFVEHKTPTCKHFGVCGGCRCETDQNGSFFLPNYDVQLERKAAAVRGLLSGFDVQSWKPILPSPTLQYYRNKMEFSFGPIIPPKGSGTDPRPPTLLLGLRERGRFDRVVDAESCFLLAPDSMEMLSVVRAWGKKHGFSGYDRKRFVGDLRYWVVREGKQTNERMAILLCSDTARDRVMQTIAELQQDVARFLTTFWVGFIHTTSDVARTEDMTLLFGPGKITERLFDLTFEISPYSFFQTNPLGTEKLYSLLREWAEPVGGALLDLYCGSGGIGLSLARSFDRILGVDSNAEAIADARRNAERNQLTNTEFVAQETEDFLAKLGASKLSVQLSAVVVDPPRPGLHPKALQTLIEINAPHVAYVSCNPESLARDLTGLIPYYHIRSVQPVDLFPHTTHVETVVLLEHR